MTFMMVNEANADCKENWMALMVGGNWAAEIIVSPKATLETKVAPGLTWSAIATTMPPRTCCRNIRHKDLGARDINPSPKPNPISVSISQSQIWSIAVSLSRTIQM